MTETHPNTRLETFCDGVFAIALTLLIIDIRIPASDVIGTSPEMWLALRHLGPIDLRLRGEFHHHLHHVGQSPCRVGEYLLTDHAAPAVVIYNSVTAVQAIAWILVSGAALRNQLTKDQKSIVVMQNNRRNGYFAFVVYSLLALIAFWFPLTIAIVTTMLWAYWLVLGLRRG